MQVRARLKMCHTREFMHRPGARLCLRPFEGGSLKEENVVRTVASRTMTPRPISFGDASEWVVTFF